MLETDNSTIKLALIFDVIQHIHQVGCLLEFLLDFLAVQIGSYNWILLLPGLR